MFKKSEIYIWIVAQTLFSVWAIILPKLFFNNWTNPATFSYQTLIFSLVFLGLYSLYKTRTLIVNKKSFNYSVLVWFFIWGISFPLMYIGMALSTASNAWFISKLWIVYTIILSALILKEKIPRIKILISLPVLVWCFLVSTGWKSLIPNVGDLLIAAWWLSYSAWMIYTQLALTSCNVSSFWTYRLFFWWLFAIIFCYILWYNITFNNPLLAATIWLLIAWAVLSLNNIIKTAWAVYMMTMSMLLPIIVSLASYMFLNESLNIVQVFWVILIIVSIYYFDYVDNRSREINVVKI